MRSATCTVTSGCRGSSPPSPCSPGRCCLLVGAPNLIQLIIGWEGVGLASYLLIGFYWEDLDNVRAGNKAFLVNKVADVGLLLGAIIVAVAVGSFDFETINIAATEHLEALSSVAVVGGLLLFLGAMGKSAQFPFHIWLPDAMAGPTPVSALMHAATMVTAGIYLMARTFPLFQNLAEDSRARGWSGSAPSPCSRWACWPWWQTTSRRCWPIRLCPSSGT